MTQLPPEENPFRNYRHTASLAGMPLFVISLVLLLASVQPDNGRILGWSSIVFAVLLVVIIPLSMWIIAHQTRKENPHCQTAIGRRYMTFVFICSLTGVASVAWLAATILKKWILTNGHVLLVGIGAALAIALIGSAILWRILGHRYNPKKNHPNE